MVVRHMDMVGRYGEGDRPGDWADAGAGAGMLDAGCWMLGCWERVAARKGGTVTRG